MNQETDLFQTEESKVTDNVYGMAPDKNEAIPKMKKKKQKKPHPKLKKIGSLLASSFAFGLVSALVFVTWNGINYLLSYFRISLWSANFLYVYQTKKADLAGHNKHRDASRYTEHFEEALSTLL